MVVRRKLSIHTQALVRRRARGLCEYCHTSEVWQYVLFTIDHVIPINQGGSDDADNLALACFHCNRRKGKLQDALDPQTGETLPLFNPRQDDWQEHFIWSKDGLDIVALTPVGRATSALLEFNRPRWREIRAADVIVKRHPPECDSVQG